MYRQGIFWTNLTGALLLAIVSATPIMMSSVMNRGYEIAKLSLAEPFALFALASILLAYGWRGIGRVSVEASTGSLCLLAFLALAGLSTMLSEQPGVAFFGGYYRREGLLAWACYAAFFLAVLGWARGQVSSAIAGFLDILLLASIIPGAYAIQQRLDLDFFFVGNRDLTRPNGTLGNPVFLGAYLAILMPITAVRCWQVRRRAPELALWLSVGLLQAAGLLLSQSRGPLLASVLGLVLLAGLAAGYQRSRKALLAIGMFAVAVVAVLVVVNTQATARQWATDTPVLGRLVYKLEANAPGTVSSLASRSTAARLGIWQAATDTFVEAPAPAKWMGFGPESAYTHYYPHLPDEAMRVDGYWQSNSYDRFHADTLDIGLNYGALGWLFYCAFFSVVLLAAARALFGIGGQWLYGLFAALPLIGGAIAIALVTLAGLPAAIAPAAGLGVGGAWLLFFLVASWRALRKGLPESARARPEPWALLAGLTASLLVFWMDAQVNIPVLTTRLISFGVCALILAVATMMSKPAPAESGASTGDTSWALALPIVAACASFLPAVILDPSLGVRETERWWLAGIPIGSLLAFSACHAWIRLPEGVSRRHAAWRWTRSVPGPIALYAACHWALVARVGPMIEESHVLRLATVAGFGILFVFLLCVVRARADAQVSDAPHPSDISAVRVVATLPVLALAALTAYFAWIAIKADVGSTVANWAASKQAEVSDRILLEAMNAMPHERHYQRQRTFDFLGRAMDEIKRNGVAPENFPGIKLALDSAENQARESALKFPEDPWIILALANALQIRALSVVRPLAPTEGRKAAIEADELFARAYEIFPNQPLLLRNWAQLRLNEGDNWGAYRLLDRMESIIPNEIEPYAERIAFARQLDDSSTIRETVARAESRLDQARLDQLRTVAGMPQK